MPSRPWTPERTVDPDLARRVVERRFPDLAPATVEPLGVGWDNTACRVNGSWVVRFPRRQIAAGLLDTEHRVLPPIAPRLPLPVPSPTRFAPGDDLFPWPCAGHRILPGRTADRARPDDAQRRAAAVPLARFLRALHAVDEHEARRLGAPPDELRRLDVAWRAPRVAARLDEIARLGVIDDPGPWRSLIDEAPTDPPLRSDVLVHGDLHGRQLLVDDHRRLTGVIDWGDVHLGDPAVDLAVAHAFLPPDAHDDFRAAYGRIEEFTWRLARFRALQTAVLLVVSGLDTGDEDLAREGCTGLRFLGGTNAGAPVAPIVSHR